MIELVESATDELLVVSFASYDEPRLLAALRAAVERGVDLTILLERAEDNPTYSGHGESFAGLPVRRWIWPGASRPPGAALHAKILVVDRSAAVLGSANLTGRALGTNLECGALLRGGPQPGAIHDHLWSLRYRGARRRVPPSRMGPGATLGSLRPDWVRGAEGGPLALGDLYARALIQRSNWDEGRAATVDEWRSQRSSTCSTCADTTGCTSARTPG